MQNRQFEISPFLSEVPKFSQKSLNKATSLPFKNCVFFFAESEINHDSRKFTPSEISLLQSLRNPRQFNSVLTESICTSSDDGKDKKEILFSIKENISSNFSNTSTRFLSLTERYCPVRAGQKPRIIRPISFIQNLLNRNNFLDFTFIFQKNTVVNSPVLQQDTELISHV